jgi:hypothetical protein
MIIDAYSQASWPVELRELLAANAEHIRNYYAERNRISRAAEANLVLRVNPPANPHQEAWNNVLAEASRIASGCKILGYHATRLTDDEAADVAANGMRVLSNVLFEERVERAIAARLLTADDAAGLRGRNQISDVNRSGMCWFVFTRTPLSDESGIERLFRSWGGEALYNSHEDDEQTGPRLRKIGSPRIIVAAVPAARVHCFMDVGQRLINIWCAKQSIRTGHYPDFEGYVRGDIPGRSIVRVIHHSDAEFVELTKHTDWDEPL